MTEAAAIASMPELDVSVIIPALDAQRFIEESVDSALTQSNVTFEVIVIDDSSDDDTASIAEQIADREPRLSVYRNEQTRGPSYSRNRGISSARGKWIALLDADDYFAPGRLQHLVRLAEDQELDLLADNITIVSETGAPLGNAFGAASDAAVGLVTIQKFLELNRPVAPGVKLGYVKPIIRRDFLLQSQLSYTEDMRVGEDFLFYAHCLLNGGRFRVIADAFYCYRLADDSMTRSQDDALERTRQLMKVNAELLEHPEIAGDPVLRGMVAKRANQYEALVMYTTLVGAVRRKELAGCVREVRRNFRSVPGLLVVTAGALRRRFVVWRGGVSAFRGQRFREVGPSPTD